MSKTHTKEDLQTAHTLLAHISIDLLFDPEHLKEVDRVLYSKALLIAMEIISNLLADYTPVESDTNV